MKSIQRRASRLHRHHRLLLLPPSTIAIIPRVMLGWCFLLLWMLVPWPAAIIGSSGAPAAAGGLLALSPSVPPPFATRRTAAAAATRRRTTTSTQLDHRRRRHRNNNNSSSSSGQRQRRYRPLPQRRNALDIEQGILFGDDSNSRHDHRNNNHHHHQQQQCNYDYIVGSDESGVGAIAGPVVAVSCCIVESIHSYVPLAMVRDGKRVSLADCQAIYEHIVQHTPDVYQWTCSVLSPREIDDACYSYSKNNNNKTSVQQLTVSKAFGDSIPRLAQNIVDGGGGTSKTTPPRFYSIVDGPKSPPNLSFLVQKDGSSNNTSTAATVHRIRSRPWIQADATVYTVALASCLARALHHQHVQKLAAGMEEQYARYELARHGGYPTRRHLELLHRHGPAPGLHRRSCRPVERRWRHCEQQQQQQQQQQPSSSQGSGTEEDDDNSGTAPTLVKRTDSNVGSAMDRQSFLVSPTTAATTAGLTEEGEAGASTLPRTGGDNKTRKKNAPIIMMDRQSFVFSSAAAAAAALAVILFPQQPAHAAAAAPGLPEPGEIEAAVPTDTGGWSDVDNPVGDKPLPRLDSSSDAAFYREPRFVEHVDGQAVRRMTEYIASVLLPSGGGSGVSTVLDLCASWTSHIPPSSATKLQRVAGLGMNAAELQANPALTEWTVQDLNERPAPLPYADDSFDLILCQLSVDYLTQPGPVFRELLRVARAGGTVHVLFSNRLFLTKAVAPWTSRDDADRARLVASYLHYCTATATATATATGDGFGWDNIRARDLSVRDRRGRIVGDPLYVVAATKTKLASTSAATTV